MQSIRKKCEKWFTNNHRQILSAHVNYSQEQKNVYITVAAYAFEKLPMTEETKVPIRKTYSELFHAEIKKEDLSPVEYPCRFFCKCKSHHVFTEWAIRIFVRDLPHDIEWVPVKRCELTDVIPISCSMQAEFAIEYDSPSITQNRLAEKMKNYREQINTCSYNVIMRRPYLKSSLAASKKKMDSIISSKSVTCSAFNKENDVVNGEFFNSAANVSQVADFMLHLSNSLACSGVLSILTSSVKLYGRLDSFSKGECMYEYG